MFAMIMKERKETVFRRVLPFLVLILALILFVLFQLHSLTHEWRRFVHRAKTEADPVALQRWATNAFNQHSDQFHYDVWETNLPGPIARLYDNRPLVVVPTMEQSWADEACIEIVWGRGYPSILVGRPNFVPTNKSAELWIPGVYLEKPSD